jgi:hypothetical protein
MYIRPVSAPSQLVQFKVYLLRNGGRRRAWRSVINGPSYIGDLRSRTLQRGGGRYHVLELFQPQAPAAGSPIPELFEPVLVGFSPLAFQIRGFERVESTDGPVGVVQEWHCERP